jgi:hypothetical protein
MSSPVAKTADQEPPLDDEAKRTLLASLAEQARFGAQEDIDQSDIEIHKMRLRLWMTPVDHLGNPSPMLDARLSKLLKLFD